MTTNFNKFNEIRPVLAEYKVATAFLRIKTTEIQNDDIENVARDKSIEAAKKYNLPIMVEDAGIFIEELNGFPGPYSSYVYRTLGTKGILKLMKDIDKRNAYFRSVVAFCDLEINLLKCFHGKVEGRISREERGHFGFGFDPIFEPLKSNNTFAEMTMKEKNKRSHRTEALRKFAIWYVSSFSR